MRIVGLDLSLTSTGIAIVDDGALTGLHNVKTSKRSARGQKDTWEQRQDRIYEAANTICVTLPRLAPDDVLDNPDIAVVEAPSYGSSGGAAHDRSGLWWIVVNALMNDGVKVAMVSPKGRAKFGTGNGNSDKPTVQAHVMERYADLAPRRIKNDDECDAILLADMGATYYGCPLVPAGLPQANLDALGGVLWPAML